MNFIPSVNTNKINIVSIALPKTDTVENDFSHRFNDALEFEKEGKTDAANSIYHQLFWEEITDESGSSNQTEGLNGRFSI